MKKSSVIVPLTLAVLIVGTLSVFNNKKSEDINNTKLNIQKISTQSNMHVNYNKDEEVYYAIEYYDIMNTEDVTIGDSISNNEVCKLANSFKKAEDIRNIDYTIIQ